MKKLINGFFRWYDRHYLLNVSIAAVLFLLQLLHLFWLGADVIALRLFHHSFFPLTSFWLDVIILVDYTEIPALVSTALLYAHDLKKNGYNFKSALFIVLLASQILHMFWITDTFVVQTFAGRNAMIGIPEWLAWVAILIDYLEVPVIIDTIKKVLEALEKKDLKKAAAVIKEEREEATPPQEVIKEK